MPHPLVSFLPALLSSERTLRAVATRLHAPEAADGVRRLIERVRGEKAKLPPPSRCISPNRLVRRRAKPPHAPLQPRLRYLPMGDIPEPPPKPDDPMGEAMAEASSARALALELIRHAATDWVRYRESPHKVRRSWAEEAQIWLFEEDQYPECETLRKAEGRELTSFVAICHELDLSPEAVRRRIREIPAQALKAHHARKLSRPNGSSKAPESTGPEVEVHAALEPLFNGDRPSGYEGLAQASGF